MTEEEYFRLQIKGSEPINIAVRCVRLAELFLNGDRIFCRLLFKPIFDKATAGDSVGKHSQARLRVKLVPDKDSPGLTEEQSDAAAKGEEAQDAGEGREGE